MSNASGVTTSVPVKLMPPDPPPCQHRWRFLRSELRSLDKPDTLPYRIDTFFCERCLETRLREWP